jgi:hypothetical protein
MTVLTLIVIALLCLLFKSTRLVGLAGITLLLCIFPILSLMLLLGCIGFYLYRKFKWRNLNVYTQPKLPPGCP